MRPVKVNERLQDRLALTANEIVAMTGVGRNTVYAALQSGQLNGRRIGVKKWIVEIDEVKKWLKSEQAD